MGGGGGSEKHPRRSQMGSDRHEVANVVKSSADTEIIKYMRVKSVCISSVKRRHSLKKGPTYTLQTPAGREGS